MNEYMPKVFYDKDYKSEYSNSLYMKIKGTIGVAEKYVFTKEDYIDPAFLKGEGTLTCIKLNTPEVTFDAHIESESLIQLPQFYYDGYQVVLTNKYTSEISNAEITNVDSLVSFTVPKGEYIITVTYPGPAIRRAFNVVFFIGMTAIGALTAFSIVELIKEKREEKETD